MQTPADVDDARVQARLADLHRRQKEDIRQIVAHLRANATALAVEIVKGRRRYVLGGVGPELAEAFSRYQDSEDVADMVEVLLNPNPSARLRAASGDSLAATPTRALTGKLVALSQRVEDPAVDGVLPNPALVAAGKIPTPSPQAISVMPPEPALVAVQ